MEKNNRIGTVKTAIIFPKDSEAIFNNKSHRTFGGATVQLYLIAKELIQRESVSVLIFIPDYLDKDYEKDNAFVFVRMFKEDETMVSKIYKFHKKIRKTRPDVIIQRGLTLFSCLAAAYCRLFGFRFVFMFAHDVESEGRYQASRKKCPFFSMLIRNSYLLVTQNDYQNNNIRKITNANHLHTVKKGLDFNNVKRSSRKFYDAVWIARCERWKNPEIFIELAGRNPDLKFLMVCSKVDAHSGYFNEIAEKASVVPNLEFRNFVMYNSIYELISLSRCFCLTSDQEGDWPMTVLEATASGVPILSLNLDYGELIAEYKAGFFCDGDIEKLHRYLRLLAEDADLLIEMGQNAVKYVYENHNIKDNVSKLLEISNYS